MATFPWAPARVKPALTAAFLVAACGLIAPSDGSAQSAGSISGKVVDIAGNPVAGARVEARVSPNNQAPNNQAPKKGDGPAAEPVSTTTSAEGAYILAPLPAGSYQLTSTSPGFAPFSQNEVRVTGGDLTLNIQLQDFQLNTLGDGREFFAAAAARRRKVTGTTPRLANGKPDLSGLWYSQDTVDPGKPVPTPWGAAIRKQREANDGRDFPQSFCLPMGVSVDASIGLWQVVQTPTILVLVSEPDNPGRRLIYLDGRARPRDFGPTWYGRSAGHWEGDTLVVDSTGFNDKSWLPDSYAHSEKLHVTERYSRPDLGRLEIEFTLEDPDALEKPWVIKRTAALAPDEQLMEYICNENEKDRKHLTGK